MDKDRCLTLLLSLLIQYIFLFLRQFLRASELTQVPLSNFGWSVSGGEDLDGNSYPDLVIGAHTSDKAFVFRTRPVVSIKSTVK